MVAQTVRITYFGADGEGSTVTEARRDAGERIGRMLGGSYTPQLIGSLRDNYSALLWREPKYGWNYKIIGPEQPEGALHSCTSGDDYESAKRHATRHLATLLFDAGDPATWQRSLDLVEKADRREIADYIGWQAAAHQCRTEQVAAGAPEDTEACRAFADAHRLEFAPVC